MRPVSDFIPPTHTHTQVLHFWFAGPRGGILPADAAVHMTVAWAVGALTVSALALCSCVDPDDLVPTLFLCELALLLHCGELAPARCTACALRTGYAALLTPVFPACAASATLWV